MCNTAAEQQFCEMPEFVRRIIQQFSRFFIIIQGRVVKKDALKSGF